MSSLQKARSSSATPVNFTASFHNLRVFLSQRNDLGSRALKGREHLTGNAAVVIIRQGTQGGGAVARKSGTMHKCQRARREPGEAADGRTHSWAEA